jgi:hypothetical protein
VRVEVELGPRSRGIIYQGDGANVSYQVLARASILSPGLGLLLASCYQTLPTEGPA